MYLLLGNILDLSSSKNRDNSRYCSGNTQGKHAACRRHNFGKVIDEKLNEEFSLLMGERKNICRGDWKSMLCAVVTTRHCCEVNTHLGKSSTRKKRLAQKTTNLPASTPRAEQKTIPLSSARCLTGCCSFWRSYSVIQQIQAKVFFKMVSVLSYLISSRPPCFM